MKKILAALLALLCAPAAAQNYLRDDGIFHSVVEGTTNGQVLINSGGLLAGTSSFPACATCAVTNATNIFTADQKFSSGTNITIPTGSTYTMSGAIQATGAGGLSVGGWTQFFGGAMFLGTGSTTTGIGTSGFPLGSGQVVFNLNSANASAVGGCGGAAIDFDNANLQTMTIGNLGSVTNCIIAGITSYDATPTIKMNQGRLIFYSGSPTLGGSTTSMIGTLDYAQGMRVNLNTTLTFGALTAPLTGASLQLTQANTTTNRIQMDSYGASNFISGVRSNGTKASPTALVVDNEIIGLNAYGFGTSVQGPAGHIGLYAAGTWSGASTPTYIDLSTTPSGSTTQASRVRIDPAGVVTIVALSSGIVTSTSGALSATATVGSGSVVLASSTSTTVNGQTCALGSSCTVTATASTITAGTTLVASGTSNGVLTNSGGTLANTAAGTNGQLFLGVTSGQPAFATMSGDATITNAGVLTVANNAITLAKLATQATNTVLGNATSGSAVPTALTMTSCSTAASAVTWTTNTGFGCNTAITASTMPTMGLTGTLQAAQEPAHTGDVTNTAGSLALVIGATKVTSAMLNADVFSTAHTWAGQQTFVAPILGTPASGVVTNLTGTASININGTVGATTPTTIASTTIAASGIVTITNTTDITVPTPYVASGALNVAGGGTFSKKLQVLGGFIFLGDGTNSSNNGITAGQVGFNINGGTSGAAAGGVIDFDSGNAQAFTLGTFGAVTNGLVSGVFDLTPTLKSNKSSGDLFRFVKHLTNSTISTALTLGTDLSATFGGAVTIPGTTTFTLAPVFTDASGTRTALGLGTIATLSSTAGGDLAGTWPSPTINNAPVIAKVLTAYSASAGTVASTDSILQAFQKLGGLVDNAAWSTYAPNVASSTAGATPATYTVNWARYKQLGKTVTAVANVTVANQGIGALGSILIDLPFTASSTTNAQWVGTSYEYSATGKSGRAWVNTAGTTMQCRDATATTYIVTGNAIVAEVTYEVP